MVVARELWLALVVAEDPDLPAAAHLERLTARMDAEVRAEQAEYEAMALQAERRARSLSDVAQELVVRGDVVEVHTGHEALRGTVVQVGRDYVVVRAARGDVDVRLAGLTSLRVIERVRAGGRPARSGAATLRARLTEHETAGTPVVIALADGQQVQGAVGAAAADHLLVLTRRGEVVIPYPALRAVWPSPPEWT